MSIHLSGPAPAYRLASDSPAEIAADLARLVALPSASADNLSAAAEPDPIMPAIAELDRAADAFAEAWTDWVDVLSTFDPTGSTDWGEGADLVRQRLAPIAGPAVLAYQEIVDQVEAAGAADTAAQAAFMATRPISAFGVAAYRAAARRYASRPTGTGADEAAMLARLDGMMVAAG